MTETIWKKWLAEKAATGSLYGLVPYQAAVYQKHGIDLGKTCRGCAALVRIIERGPDKHKRVVHYTCSAFGEGRPWQSDWAACGKRSTVERKKK